MPTPEIFDPFPKSDYREPFICPYHHCVTDHGWCWECAQETYGYDKAKEIHEELISPRDPPETLQD